MSRIVKRTRFFTRSGSVYEVRINAAGDHFFTAVKVTQDRFLPMEGATFAINAPFWWPGVGDRLTIATKEPLLPTSDKYTLSTSPITEVEEVEV